MTADHDESMNRADNGAPDRHRDEPAKTTTSEPERRLRDALDRVARQQPVPDGWATIHDRVTGAELPQGAIPMSRTDRPSNAPPRAPRVLIAAAVVAVVALAATVLVLTNRDADGTTDLAAGPPVDAPRRGGTVRYAVADLAPSGYCLPEQKFSPAQTPVLGAIYDPLTAPNSAGEYAPYLARSVTPNVDHTVWAIALRPGVTFHDGSALTASVVKNNLDAYRGSYVDRSPQEFFFVFANIASTEVVDDLTVRVTTKEPWVSFPAALYSSGRVGMMAQAQLDAPDDGCSSDPIGTGPFSFESSDPDGAELLVERNARYWQTAPDGEPYPYADRIEFSEVSASDGPALLAADDIDVLRTDSPAAIGTDLPALMETGDVELTTSNASGQVVFVRLNTTKPPFDDISMRRAFALALDRQDLANGVAGDLLTVADGPFAPDTVGHLADTGFPTHDAAQARSLVDAYVNGGGSPSFELLVTDDPTDDALADAIRQQADAAGFAVTVREAPLTEVIGNSIAKQYQAVLDRSATAGDPDQNHALWHGGTNPLNFGGFDDQTVNDLLDQGRAEADPTARQAIYEDLNRQFGDQVYDIWLWFQPWAVATRPGVGSVTGPSLPGDDAGDPDDSSADDPVRQPSTDLSNPHSLLGLSAGS